jgi:hypothetical protein
LRSKTHEAAPSSPSRRHASGSEAWESARASRIRS